MLERWWQALLDLMYPPKCPACRQGVAEQGEWCGSCTDKIAAYREIAVSEHHLRAVDSCRTLYEYEGSLKRMIHDMKFRKVSRYGQHLNWLLSYGSRNRSFDNIHFVMPVPLHSERLSERGFNQTELIFKNWALARGFEWLAGLTRVRKTRPQWELTLADRKDNIKGAFRVSCPERITGRNVLLVDDIFTTGLTLDECAKTLKKAGAKQVHCLTLASNAR